MLKRSWPGVAALVGMLSSWHSVAAATWPAGLPVYDHIVIVIEENKDYEKIILNKDAAFINQLAADGALFTNMFGEEHNSEGNYFWLFSGANLSGSDQGDNFNDAIPKKKLTTSNLGQQLIARGLSFKGYAEDLPAIGAEDASPPASSLSRVVSRSTTRRLLAKMIVERCSLIIEKSRASIAGQTDPTEGPAA